jgi:predicted GNAT family acetyltransferase
MILKTFHTAAEFLQEAQPALQANEAANNLMYGLALRLRLYPERIETPPYLAVVRSEGELQAAALMTPPHNLVVLSTQADSAPETFDLVARNLVREHWPVPGVVGPNEPALAFARAWQVLTAEPYRLTTHERLYSLRQVIAPPQPAGCMRLAVGADLDLVAKWVYDFHIEAVPLEAISLEEALISTRAKIADQDFYLWEDGAPLALAGRTRPTPYGMCIGPVYTPPEFRGKGYATALTAALSQRLLDTGKQFTALFTNLANPISNSIYQKIGYHPVCDFDLYRFEK